MACTDARKYLGLPWPMLALLSIVHLTWTRSDQAPAYPWTVERVLAIELVTCYSASSSPSSSELVVYHPGEIGRELHEALGRGTRLSLPGVAFQRTERALQFILALDAYSRAIERSRVQRLDRLLDVTKLVASHHPYHLGRRLDQISQFIIISVEPGHSERHDRPA